MEKHVLVADDHWVVRKGIRVLCESHFGIRQIDDAASCSQILASLKRKYYSHIVLDIAFSDGISLEIIPTIRNLYPALQIIIFSTQSENLYKNVLSLYGVYGFISKSCQEEEILTKLRSFFYNEKVPSRLKQIGKTTFLTDLAPRELEVLHYLVGGKKVTEIAQTLNINKNTVSTLKLRIFAKTKVDNLFDLKELVSIYNRVNRR